MQALFAHNCDISAQPGLYTRCLCKTVRQKRYDMKLVMCCGQFIRE